MLAQNDLELRARLDPRDLKETKEQIKKIWIMCIEGESTAMINCKGQQGMPQLIEKTKLYDKIYQEHNIKIH